jgi:hypothetical protein
MVYNPLDCADRDYISVQTPKSALYRWGKLCKDYIEGWWLLLTITIPAVVPISRVGMIWTKAAMPIRLNWASCMMKRHFNWVGMHPAVHLTWLCKLVPIQRIPTSCLAGLRFLHLVNPVKRTIWIAYWSHCKAVTGIHTASWGMYMESFRQLKYWSQFM